MKRVLFVGALVFAAVGVAAAEDTDQAKLEKECASLFAKGGPCEGVPKGELRACITKPENLKKATPSCKAVVSKFKKLPKL